MLNLPEGYKIIEITDSNLNSLEKLCEDSLADGHHGVEKTIREWRDGTNNFSKTGEKFWGIFFNDECIGIGGVGIDPYLNDETIGRVRHIYISTKHRRLGLARILLTLITKKAKENFKSLRLATHNPAAIHLYESFGFKKKEGDAHVVYEIEDLKNFPLD